MGRARAAIAQLATANALGVTTTPAAISANERGAVVS
jgi:hypothetical protein